MQWRPHGSSRLPSWHSLFREAPSGLSRTGPSCARGSGFFRPLSRATALMSFSTCSGPLPSGFDHAVGLHVAVSRGRSRTGCAQAPPEHIHLPIHRAALSRTPSASEFPLHRRRTLCNPALARGVASAAEAATAGPVDQVSLNAGVNRVRGPSHRCDDRPLVDRAPRIPAGTLLHLSRDVALLLPNLLRSWRLVSEAHGSFAGCPADFSSARPLREGCPSVGESVPPDPHVPSPWFDPHRDGLLRAPVSRLLHLVPASASLLSTSRSRRPSRWLPSGKLGEGDAGISRSVAFTPLEEHASRPLTRMGRKPWTRRTASPQPLPPCRFHDFEAFLGPSRPVRA